MAFNQLVVKNYAATVVALTGKTAGTVTSAAGLVLPCASPGINIEFDSLIAIVSAGITTSTLVAATQWQGSNDGVNWLPIYGLNAPANVAVAPAGTGSLVTTAYAHACPVNPSFPYLRVAVLNTVATGGAGDNVTVGYNFRKRWNGA